MRIKIGDRAITNIDKEKSNEQSTFACRVVTSLSRDMETIVFATVFSGGKIRKVFQMQIMSAASLIGINNEGESNLRWNIKRFNRPNTTTEKTLNVE